MNTSRKAMEWLTCFSNVNLMLGCLLFKKFKKFYESSNAFWRSIKIIAVSKLSSKPYEIFSFKKERHVSVERFFLKPD